MNRLPISERIFLIVMSILTGAATIAFVYQGIKVANIIAITNLKKQEHLSDLEYQYQHAVFDKRYSDIQIILGEDEAILLMIETQQKVTITQNPVQCLTDNIYYEAGFEPYEGQLAVAQVTLNRAREKTNNICNVVYFKKVNPNTGKKEAAFSWTLGSHWRARGINRTAYRMCAQMAKAVLTNHLRSDIIDSSVEFYHADYISPRWKNSHEMVAQIGAHIFYR